MKRIAAWDEAPAPGLGHATYERLRDLILGGALPADTALQEKRLADQLGVSRTPVREAITRLVAEGLVVRNGGLTPVVRRLSIGDFVEILHVRRLLEVEAAGLAAEAGGSPELEAVRARIEGFRREAPSPDEHVAVDDLLHATITSLAGSRLLTDLVQGLRQRTKIFDMGQMPHRFEPGIVEHLAIIDAVLARDPDGAKAAMRAHLDNVLASVIARVHRLA
ncbi:GntR family transcriptional regulator [Salinarimonas soli]|uniref:GntR family transcriptional regulator n=1 Tax=Salinarimonas soli TaxID=1638099 RepID=A0A5B2VB80_9HYPH|nr:GntR family transcriptional regulator [Salinarimonas soli]KAA2236311.1 GntR family transcriptional regulator [Salinarimonas soli]